MRKKSYYLVPQESFNVPVLEQCFAASLSSVWHSLALLTTCDLSEIEGRKLSLALIEEASMQASALFIGAYDAEGFIFWEKSVLGGIIWYVVLDIDSHVFRVR